MKLSPKVNFGPRQSALLFAILLASLLLIRFVIYIRYNIALIDTDQPYMWLAARDYAAGNFYEPRYYGQDYNTYFEALVAVPLLWLNVTPYLALPLVTHALSLFPYVFAAVYLYRRQRPVAACLVLVLLLLLPMSYHLINGLPRGFVTGLFFCSFLIVSLHEPKRYGLVAINVVLSVVAYLVNPNSVLVSAPVLFYLFLCNLRDTRFYYYTVPALLSYLPLDWLFNGFYRRHPEYVIHPLENSFSWQAFVQSISNLDKRFAQLVPITENNSLLLLALMAVLGYLLFTRNRKAFWAYLLFFAVLLISFFAGKTSEGSTWVYMPYSRMYLGIPLLLCLFATQAGHLRLAKVNYLLLAMVASLVFSLYKLSRVNRDLAWIEYSHNVTGVRLMHLESCKEVGRFYKQICRQSESEFMLVSSWFWLNTFISQAGPALIDDYPEIQETWLEKRWWVREKNKNRVIPRFVYLSSDYDFDQKIGRGLGFDIRRIDNNGLFLIYNNTLPLGHLLQLIYKAEPGWSG